LLLDALALGRGFDFYPRRSPNLLSRRSISAAPARGGTYVALSRKGTSFGASSREMQAKGKRQRQKGQLSGPLKAVFRRRSVINTVNKRRGQ
jgi:hypothetical protein